MSRLIDADALKSYMDECSKESKFRVYYAYAEAFINYAPTINAVPVYFLKKQPTIDAVTVVRCRDCLFFNVGHGCPLRESGYFKDGRPLPHENDFCSYGERKDGAD